MEITILKRMINVNKLVIFTSLLLIMQFGIFSENAIGQTVGDYRSAVITNPGNWSTLASWERWNGTTWVTPTAGQGWPGQITTSVKVTIYNDDQIILDAGANPGVTFFPFKIDSLIVTGLDSRIASDGERYLNVGVLIVEENADINWSSSNSGNKSFYLPAGTALLLKTGGQLLNSTTACSGAQRLYIGTCQYATCGGTAERGVAGFIYSFEAVNNAGGTFNVSAGSNSPVCLTNPINLTATIGGNVIGTPTFSWTGPSAYATTVQNPTRVGATLAFAGSYTVTASNTPATGCNLTNSSTVNVVVTRLNKWTGAIDSLWSKPGNWSCNALPVYESDVQIPAVFNNPILDINYTVGFNMLMYGFEPPTNPIQNNSLVIAPNATLAVDATTNFAGYKVTVRSNATGTGSIGKISGAFVSGDNDFVVERYIPGSKRRWNLLTIPVSNSTATIRDMWGGGGRPRVGNSQLDGTIYLPNPFPGNPTDYVAGDATIITGHRHLTASSANNIGYDWWPELIITGLGANGGITATSPSSIRPYRHGDANNTGTGFVSRDFINNGFGGSGLINAIVNDVMPAEQGFMLYTRGDRSVLHDRFGATTLRPYGSLKKLGQPSVIIVGKGIDPLSPILSVVGNPYPSPVNFELLRALPGNSSSIENRFWYWDSNLPGSTGDGGFRLVTQPTPGGNWVATPLLTGSTLNTNVQMISSGQAILVEGTSGGGPLIFTEDAKSTTNNAVLPFEVEESVQTTNPGLLFVNLHKNSNGQLSLVDGAMGIFGKDNVKGLGDGNDIFKIANFLGSLNISFLVDGKHLASDALPMPVNEDRLLLNIAGLSAGNFALEFAGFDLAAEGRTAFLIDKYTGTETLIQLVGNTQYLYNVATNNDASAAPGRFEIVFKQSEILPVTFTSVNAVELQKNVKVTWGIATEENMSHYEVEHSRNGTEFAKAIKVTAKNTSPASYDWLHILPGTGTHFYRIRALNLEGRSLTTKVVKVDIGATNPVFQVFPTVVSIGNRQVTVQMTSMEKGLYNLQISDMSGRVIQSRKIEHNGGSASLLLQLPPALSAGKYNIRLTGASGKFIEPIVKD